MDIYIYCIYILYIYIYIGKHNNKAPTIDISELIKGDLEKKMIDHHNFSVITSRKVGIGLNSVLRIESSIGATLGAKILTFQIYKLIGEVCWSANNEIKVQLTTLKKSITINNGPDLCC